MRSRCWTSTSWCWRLDPAWHAALRCRAWPGTLRLRYSRDTGGCRVVGQVPADPSWWERAVLEDGARFERSVSKRYEDREVQDQMAECVADPMDALLTAAAHVLEVHEPGDEDRCAEPDCVAAGLAGRCLPHRIADQVISTWANRSHLPVVVDGDEVEPVVNALRAGRAVLITGPLVAAEPSGMAIRHPAGTRIVRAAPGHPSWCVGAHCRQSDGAPAHVSASDRVANVLVTLMHLEGEPPVVALTDLTDSTMESTVVVPATFAASLAQAVRFSGLRATTSD